MIYLVAIFLPPAAVYYCTRRIGPFLLSCLLMLCFHIPSVIYALLVVHDYKEERRTDRIIRALGGS